MKCEINISIIMYASAAISSLASVSAGAQGRPAASSCLVGFGMSVRREFRLLGSRTTCAECRYCPCSPILHKHHDAPTGGNTKGKEKTFPNKMPNSHCTGSRSIVSTTATFLNTVLLHISAVMQTWYRLCLMGVNKSFSHHMAQVEVRLLRIAPHCNMLLQSSKVAEISKVANTDIKRVKSSKSVNVKIRF